MEVTLDIKKLLTTPAGESSLYFIGIGGIGMSALARYFHSKGVEVSGYDKTETALTKQLVAEGIKVHYTADLEAIPKEVDAVVYTPAVPKDHAELVYYQNGGYTVLKRSDILGAITRDSFNICVGGTHGKTTVSTMIAHILRHTGFGCNAFLGGIATNYNTNFWSSDNNVAVIEADEYDKSFLKLSPDIAVITAMDADHLDIYGTEEEMQKAFVAFGNKVKEGGLLFTRFGLKHVREIKVAHKLTYSTGNDAADVFAANIKIVEGGYRFDVQLPSATITGVELKMGGMHNVENAAVAIAVAHHLEIDVDKIKGAVAQFKGVKRRFEYIIPLQEKVAGAYTYPVLIDDYAHHPEELRALLKSVKSLFPQRKLTVLFQPHLFSRTKDFAKAFSDSLNIADSLILLPIYPAREQPMEGVTSEMLLKNIDKGKGTIVEKGEVLNWMQEYVKTIDKEFGEVIVVAGAGDIDTLVQPLKKIIENA
jgi:UDP-N-acetylmuramate--alanine ligase